MKTKNKVNESLLYFGEPAEDIIKREKTVSKQTWEDEKREKARKWLKDYT